MGLPYMGFKKTASQAFLGSCCPFLRLYEPSKETPQGQSLLTMPRQRSFVCCKQAQAKMQFEF